MPQCQNTVYRGRFWSGACTFTAKVERNGKWYCTIHDPEEVARKTSERLAAWQVKWKEDSRKHAQDQHRLATWERLLEACKTGLEQHELIGHADDDAQIGVETLMRAAISEAQSLPKEEE